MTRSAATAVVMLLLAAAGCAAADPDTVRTEIGAGSVELATGDVLQVDFGPYNASIGDSWHLVSDPDPTVLSELDREIVPDPDCAADAVGCGGTLAWEFQATGAGRTTLVFRYCYRSQPDDCESQPDRGPAAPVVLSVTVQ